eukprot:Gregarina_sp_Poly_1__5671@NODE_2992_length_1471_cov_7_477208_g1893_i0_p1_GENE_NODE_2992_length_1471_cov_7_477208_g1893_i0NODE_2992_length_1471_cov_7_477208_g1893_i0_p1_ORF_typecomplete_len245_score45_91_NODE_2992_length_1471_cov_7_477208_g1893_i07351397
MGRNRNRRRAERNVNDENFRQTEERQEEPPETGEAFEISGSDAEDESMYQNAEDMLTKERTQSVPLFDVGQGVRADTQAFVFGRGEESISGYESESSEELLERDEEYEEGNEEGEEESFSAWELLQLQRANLDEFEESSDPWQQPRRWLSTFYITGLNNLENRGQEFFLLVRFGHVNRSRKLKGELRSRYFYSNAFLLPPSEALQLAKPRNTKHSNIVKK